MIGKDNGTKPNNFPTKESAIPHAMTTAPHAAILTAGCVGKEFQKDFGERIINTTNVCVAKDCKNQPV